MAVPCIPNGHHTMVAMHQIHDITKPLVTLLLHCDVTWSVVAYAPVPLSGDAMAFSRWHRAVHVESQIVPLFPQSLTIRVVGSVLNDALRRYEKCIVLGNKDFRIRWMRDRHNGGHVIHVTLRWRHGKQHRSDSRSFRCRWRSGREVSDHVWIYSGSGRISPVDKQILDTQMARWYHTWFAK